MILHDVQGARLDSVTAQRSPGVPFALLRDVGELLLRGSFGLPDGRPERVERGTLP